MPLTLAMTRHNGKYKVLTINNAEKNEDEWTPSILHNIYLGKVVGFDSDADLAIIALDDKLEGSLPLKNIGPAYLRAHPPQRRGSGRRDISTLLWPEQELLVQVSNVNPLVLTTDLTLPAHYLVFTPYQQRINISKKIEDNEERERLMNLVKLLDIPHGFGFIVRTDSMGASYEDFRIDYNYLETAWLELVRRLSLLRQPGLLRELPSIPRFLLENMNSDCTAIWLDREDDFETAKQFLESYHPEKINLLKLHTEETPLFEKFVP